MKAKICTKCDREKLLSKFYRSSSHSTGYESSCKQCNREYYLENKSKFDEYDKLYRQQNTELIRESDRVYYDKNRESELLTQKNYYNKNKSAIQIQQKKYYNTRYSSDSLFKFTETVRSRLYQVFKGSKSRSTEALLGTTFEKAKQHIENQFKKGMNWSNHGEWHIDHRVPLASGSNIEEVETLCHFTNLQPLWALENLQKGAKLIC